MKILLTLSLILNLVLMGWVLTRPSVSEVSEDDFEERASIREEHPFPKTVAEEMDEEPQVSEKEHLKRAPVNEVEVSNSPAMDLDTYEFGVSAEKTEHERTEYLTRSLQIPEEVLQKHEKLREEFNQAMSKTFVKDFHEPSIEEKRHLLDLEEKYLSDSEKLYGKENWKKFQDFRQKYNERGYKRQVEEKVPFIFMSL